MFSVVIPLYNKEFSIVNTIQSVLNQTNPNFEIIVVNDGSTDNSVQLLEQLNDNRIRLIQQKNKGVSAARNRGIQEAKYEWIALLDGDDLWEANHLEEVVKMMRKFPHEKIYVTSFQYSDRRHIFEYSHENKIFKLDNYFKEAIDKNLIWTSVVVIHKSCFKTIGGFDIRLTRGEDLDLWARLAKRFNIIKSQEVTATYRVDAENRACENRNFNVYTNSVYHYDLNQPLAEDEFNYYMDKLIKTCRTLIYNRDIKSFLILYRKHIRHISLLKIFKLKP